MDFRWRSFKQLSNRELYQLLKLRQDVFVVEQNCLYADIDGEDYHHWHLLAYDGEVLVGYLRVIPADYHHSGCVAIGRVVIAMKYRGVGLASQLMQQTITFCDEKFSGQLIFLSAQQQLDEFYKGFGFVPVSDVYLEDGIAHIDMKRMPSMIP